MELESRVKAYRFVAYSAVAFSVVAVLSVCITLPMVFNYVNGVKKTLNSEINFCKFSAKDIWNEVNYIKSAPAHNRTARQAYGDEPVVGNVNSGGGGSCSGCCQPGPSGPAGTPGRPGRPGKVRLHSIHFHLSSKYSNLARIIGTTWSSRKTTSVTLRARHPTTMQPMPTRTTSPEPQETQAAMETQEPHPAEEAQDLKIYQDPTEIRMLNYHPEQPGQPGGGGEKGICPKYCAIDGGIFFEDGTRR
ncbi:hypothetical protein WR25_22509 isoform B [Diploscapter pachys]|uniref:Nematode cuticle collagen N-terminal domain-containing protein n=1 Tax=Diploscapter pachys TaxID=2018661 RepID=A0A2A2JXY6_9BILA|nr:hypothetical protein WR25_22509 isoform A [Diploscapter pachys]PAV66472.1 hypothetical protein WR25_22509 isoform B [Diploscapter pachys]